MEGYEGKRVFGVFGATDVYHQRESLTGRWEEREWVYRPWMLVRTTAEQARQLSWLVG